MRIDRTDGAAATAKSQRKEEEGAEENGLWPEKQVTPCLIFHREKKRKIGHEGTILTGRAKGSCTRTGNTETVCKTPRTDTDRRREGERERERERRNFTCHLFLKRK